MTINELKVIVNNCENDGRQSVRIRVDGDIKTTHLHVDSFGLYSDGLVLNITLDNILEHGTNKSI